MTNTKTKQMMIDSRRFYTVEEASQKQDWCQDLVPINVELLGVLYYYETYYILVHSTGFQMDLFNNCYNTDDLKELEERLYTDLVQYEQNFCKY